MSQARTKEAYPTPIKIFVLGDAKTGKSALLRSCENGSHSDYTPTIGFEFAAKTITVGVGENAVKLQIWDTAGQERSRVLTFFCRGTAAYIITYDVTNRQSFENVKGWIENIEQHGKSNVPITIVGTGLDLISDERPRKVERSELAALAASLDNKLAKVSTDEVNATSQDDAQRLFQQVGERAYKNLNRTQAQDDNDALFRQQLITQLNKYTTRIESYKGDYAHGFWFFAQSRAVNRELNYRLAKRLIARLRNTEDSIEDIFNNQHEDLEQIRRTGIGDTAKTNQTTPNAIEQMLRGINSSELNDVIKKARAPRL